jgi:hypothetical protein
MRTAVVAHKLFVGDRIIAGYEQHAQGAYKHAQREKNNCYVITPLLHTNNPRPYYRQKSKRA